MDLKLHQIETRALRKFKYYGINYLQNKKTLFFVVSIAVKAKQWLKSMCGASSSCFMPKYVIRKQRKQKKYHNKRFIFLATLLQC